MSGLLDSVDFRIVLVLAPIAIAASWAIFNIGAAAIGQFRQMLGE
ncbi:MAG: photosystem II protein Y [Cyanobacteria bacterium P01_H01_bin.15]